MSLGVQQGSYFAAIPVLKNQLPLYLCLSALKGQFACFTLLNQ